MGRSTTDLQGTVLRDETDSLHGDSTRGSLRCEKSTGHLHPYGRQMCSASGGLRSLPTGPDDCLSNQLLFLPFLEWELQRTGRSEFGSEDL